ANTAYRDQMKEFMLRYPERTHHPEDMILYGDVFWIQDMNPKWGDTKSWKFEKIKLFSFERPGYKPPLSDRPAAPAPPQLPTPAPAQTVPAAGHITPDR